MTKITKSSKEEHFISDLSKDSFPFSQKVEARFISGSLLTFIQVDRKEFSDISLLSLSEFKHLLGKVHFFETGRSNG